MRIKINQRGKMFSNLFMRRVRFKLLWPGFIHFLFLINYQNNFFFLLMHVELSSVRVGLIVRVAV